VQVVAAPGEPDRPGHLDVVVRADHVDRALSPKAVGGAADVLDLPAGNCIRPAADSEPKTTAAGSAAAGQLKAVSEEALNRLKILTLS
jgi:hypothetical protein